MEQQDKKITKPIKPRKPRKPVKPRAPRKATARAKPWEAKVCTTFIAITFGLIVAYFIQQYIHINETNPIKMVFDKMIDDNG